MHHKVQNELELTEPEHKQTAARVWAREGKVYAGRTNLELR